MSLIFTQKEYEKSIPWDFPPNTDILQLYLMLPPCSEDQLDDVTCYGQVTWSNCSNAEQKALEYPFAFNQTNKSLFWERSFSEAEVKSIGETILFILVNCDFFGLVISSADVVVGGKIPFKNLNPDVDPDLHLH